MKTRKRFVLCVGIEIARERFYPASEDVMESEAPNAVVRYANTLGSLRSDAKRLGWSAEAKS